MLIDHLGIDPGKTGAVAYTSDDTLFVESLATNSTLDLCSQFARIRNSCSPDHHLIMEDVGYGRPGSSIKSVTTFARHCGMLEGLMTSLDFNHNMISPQRWMSKVVPDRPIGEEAKGARKLYILQSVEDYIHTNHIAVDSSAVVDINTADAIGVLIYGSNSY